MRKIILLLLFGLASKANLAQNTGLKDIIKKEIDYNNEHYFSFDLKSLPDTDFSIAAVTKYNGEVSEDGFDCDLVVLLIDNNTEQIIDRFIQKKKYTSDSFQLSPVSLDMANYKVTQNKRAFGIRASYSAASRVSPTWMENLSLFIIEKNKIKLLLDEFPMGKSHGEWDTNCNYDGEETAVIAIMQTQKTNGYFDILIKSTKTIRNSSAPKTPDEPCIENNTKEKPTTQILQFVNGKYQLKRPKNA